MNLKIIISFFLCLLFFSCNETNKKHTDNENLTDIYSEIRISPQISHPKKSDKKLLSISKLRKTNDKNTPDSLEVLFYQIDTTIWEYSDYQYKILEVLIDINTAKSFRTYAKIINNSKLNSPGNMFFIWDVKDNTEKAKYLFPDLAKSIDNQRWIRDDILFIIINGFESGHLTKDDLFSSKLYLENFYDQLVIGRESVASDNNNYKGHYKYSLSYLIQCLSIFGEDPKLNNIYKNSLKDNISFYDYHNNDGRSYYHNESLPKLEILRQAALALIKNNQTVDPIYINKLIKDPFYRLIFYRDLKKLNKISLLPTKYLNQQYFAESDLITIMESTPNDGIPSNLKFLQKRKILSGKQKGNYYFFQTSYLHYDTLVYEILPSGPQPINNKEYIESGNMTNKYMGRVSLYEIDNKIDEFIQKIEAKK